MNKRRHERGRLLCTYIASRDIEHLAARVDRDLARGVGDMGVVYRAQGGVTSLGLEVLLTSTGDVVVVFGHDVGLRVVLRVLGGVLRVVELTRRELTGEWVQVGGR